MNVAVVRRTTAGLARWLLAQGRAGATVVVGRDARRGSEAFAAAAAEVLAGGGFASRRCPARCPPRCSRSRSADRRRRRGPDHRLAQPARRQRLQGLRRRRRPARPARGRRDRGGDRRRTAGRLRPAPARRSGIVDVREAYLDRGRRACRAARPRTLRIALTPLHGVGGETAVRALPAPASPTSTSSPRRPCRTPPSRPSRSRTRRSPASPTRCWRRPSGSAPTWPSPSTPTRTGARSASPPPTGWRMLPATRRARCSATTSLRHGTARPAPAGRDHVVSSSMLRAIAAAHGARFAETLTGFKWIARAGAGLGLRLRGGARVLRRPGCRPRQGRHRRRRPRLRPRGHAEGRRRRRCLDRLDELATAHGVHATAGLPVRMEPGRARHRRRAARARPPEGWTADRPAPTSSSLRRAGERAVIRPSGTEPKLKAYLQVVEPVSGDLPAARAAADARLQALRAEAEAMISGPGSGGGDHRD